MSRKRGRGGELDAREEGASSRKKSRADDGPTWLSLDEKPEQLRFGGAGEHMALQDSQKPRKENVDS